MKLDDHIHKLPTHSVKADFWSNIEEQLPDNQHWAERLPRHKADPLLWNAIEAKLETPRKTIFSLRNWSVAASIAVIFTIGLVFYSQQSTTRVYYTEEMVMETSPAEDWPVQELDLMDNCNEQPAVCTTPDFTRLKSNLEQLKLEEKKLRELKQQTNDPKIDLYHSRMVKNIQEVEARILELFS